MRKKLSLMAVVLLAGFLLGGCGTPMYELSEDEENLVVQYAAYVLAKYNTYQKDGMTNAVSGEVEDVTEASEVSEVTEASDGNPPGDHEKAEKDTGTAGTDEQSDQAVSIAEASGLEGKIEVTFLGSRVTDSYQEGTYFSVNASEHKKLVVMEFQLKNIGKKALKLDMADTGCSFLSCFDGENRISEKMTFGERILSSYSGKIKAKEQKKAYLIFEIPEGMAKNVKAGQLFVTVDNQTHPVKM